jgi:hypothetical protein
MCSFPSLLIKGTFENLINGPLCEWRCGESSFNKLYYVRKCILIHDVTEM